MTAQNNSITWPAAIMADRAEQLIKMGYKDLAAQVIQSHTCWDWTAVWDFIRYLEAGHGVQPPASANQPTHNKGYVSLDKGTIAELDFIINRTLEDANKLGLKVDEEAGMLVTYENVISWALGMAGSVSLKSELPDGHPAGFELEREREQLPETD